MLPKEWVILLTNETKNIVKRALKEFPYMSAGCLKGQYIFYMPESKRDIWSWHMGGNKSRGNGPFEYNGKLFPEISFEQFMGEFIKHPNYIIPEIY